MTVHRNVAAHHFFKIPLGDQRLLRQGGTPGLPGGRGSSVEQSSWQLKNTTPMGGVFYRKAIPEVIKGAIYVVGDHIDTDQIVPAQYLSLDPSRPDERKKFGWYALSGLPRQGQGLPAGGQPFSSESQAPGRFPLIVAGKNFGCGSSREHACIALQEAGVQAVIAEFFARIFYRNSVNGGYLIPCDSQPERLCTVIETGMEGELILSNTTKPVLQVAALKTSWTLGPLGDILPILEAGDLFSYARRHGLIPVASQQVSP